MSAFVRFAIGLAAVVLPFQPVLAQDAKKAALVVGINKYHHAALDKLQFAENDVRELKEVLEAAGYEVTLLAGAEATLGAIRKQLGALRRQPGAEGIFLAAFAGHGIQPEGSDDAFFCPFDADQRVVAPGDKNTDPWDYKSLLPLTEVVGQLKASSAGSKMLLVDACRNDPNSGRGRGVGTGLQVGTLPDNTAVLLSCSRGQRAFEDSSWGTGHGAFFHQVLLGLRGQAADDGKVTADSLWKHVNAAVPREVTRVIKGGAAQKPFRLITGEVDLRMDKLVRGSDLKPPKIEAKMEPGEHKPGEVLEVEIAKGVKMKLCWIPPGKATLGSPASEKDRNTDEAEHEFTSKGFWLGKYTVTQGEWEAVMGTNPSCFVPVQDDIKKAGITDTSRFPVEQVSWNDCQEFLTKLNSNAKIPPALGRGKFALPHEEQWEYACRGGRGNKQPYYFGDELNAKQANCNGNFPYGTTAKGPYLERTSEVGSYERIAPHPWKLCDMHGNVWQWCQNKYDYKNDARVLRGGSWYGDPNLCRAAFRLRFVRDVRYFNFGCRVCFRLD